jgi:branched-subunit amino acid ABC-type transport system permease component
MMNVINFAHGDFVMLAMYTGVRGVDRVRRRAGGLGGRSRR